MDRRFLLSVWLSACGVGCGAIVEPGHRAMLFDPGKGGLQHEVLGPGEYRVPMKGHLEDFDVTYSSRAETLKVITSEGLQIDMKVTIVYRPIISELYELDTEIGPAYYDEVVGPEARSVVRESVAKVSFTRLMELNEKLEDEMETEIRRRIRGKHVELASVTIESVVLPAELVTAVRERQIAEQKAAREKAEIDAETMKQKAESERAWELEKLELEHNVERHRLKREAEGR